MDDFTEVYGQTVPDYAHMETTNRITASGGLWVVDRTGFVNCESYVYASNNLASGVYMEASIYVNNIMVSTKSTKSAPENTTRTQTAAILQVSPGDVVGIVGSAYDSMNNNTETTDNISSAVYCRFIPPKYVSTAAPRITADALNTVPVPDYANVMPITSFNTTNTNWTADRTGFVVVRVEGYASGGYNLLFLVYINADGPILVNGTTVNIDRVRYVSHLLPVSAGDSIACYLASESGGVTTVTYAAAQFIPYKSVTTQAPNIVVSGASYSQTEMATGETWIDGKPIYRRVFQSTLPAALGTDSTQTLLASGTIDALIKYDAVVKTAGNSIPEKSFKTQNSVRYEISLCHNTTAGLVIWTNLPADSTTTYISSPVYVTVYYTKTTD
jgi:hypothetical protein